MNRYLFLSAVCFFLFGSFSAVISQEEPVVPSDSAIVSGADVAGNIPLPEHPRPDFERTEWMNLNGDWHFTFNPKLAEKALKDNDVSAFDLNIQVPFPWGSKLSKVENKADIAWYGRTVTVPESWKGKRVFLVVGACDWKTQAWMDGVPLGCHQGGNTHQGGYTPFEFELTKNIRYGKPQTLLVNADDTPSDQRLYGKQGYGDAKGIWQTVYLEARGNNHIDHIHFSPDVDRSTVKVKVALAEPPAKNSQIQLVFKNGEQADFIHTISEESAVQQFEVKLENQRLWDLDDPYLYEMEAILVSEKQPVDKVNTYFGQRKIGIVNLPGTDYPYVALNDKPVYLQTCLDQSYHPEGFYTFPDDAFMRNEILLSKRLGLNGNRIHIKVEVPRKLYWADKLGLLIMADVPNWWGEPDDAAKKDWEYCMHQQIKRDFNHPSIFSWVDFNETWGLLTNVDGKKVFLPETQEWVRQKYLETKALDPTRLVEDNSPCRYDHVQTDLNTWHAYLPGYEWKAMLDKSVEKTYVGSTWNFIGGNKQENVPMFNSECGNVWGYTGSAGDIDYTWDYHIMMNEFRSHPKCAGWLYTEHHDVINEWNGYFRYDRSEKFDGFCDFVPGMSIADLHTLYYIAPQGELCREAKGGENVQISLFASFMTDKNPGALVLETNLIGWDVLGNKSSQKLKAYPVPFKPFMNEMIDPVRLTLPEQTGVYALQLELKNSEGAVLGRNFSLFRIKEGKPPVSKKERRLYTFAPKSFTKSEWSRKQWNVLDGLKVNGAGTGYFEYTVPWPTDCKLEDTESVMLVFEASAKELFGKDALGLKIINDDNDFMHGRGTFDPCMNKNSYAMTDETKFPSMVKVRVNGAVCGDAYLPDDPADHRGVLSWSSQPRNRTLSEAGSYGYLVQAIIPKNVLKEGESITIRMEVPEGITGGLAIYGKDFGRYPLDPTFVFVKK